MRQIEGLPNNVVDLYPRIRSIDESLVPIQRCDDYDLIVGQPGLMIRPILSERSRLLSVVILILIAVAVLLPIGLLLFASGDVDLDIFSYRQ